MDKELPEAAEVLKREKNVSKDTLVEVVENSLLATCKGHFGKVDNMRVMVDPSTCDPVVYTEKTVMEDVEDDYLEMGLAGVKMLNPKYEIGGAAQILLGSKKFGRIATRNAKNVILQKIREEEREALCNRHYVKERDVMTGVVQRYLGGDVSVNLGRVGAVLNGNEQVKGEAFRPTERVKVYAIETKDAPKDLGVFISRTRSDLAGRLFESEVVKVRGGTMEIKITAEETGSRTKTAVKSNDVDMDPVGACADLSGSRISSTVSELKGGEIDIINWDDDPTYLIENTLNPAKIICVMADREEREAQVIAPDCQLSPVVGREGRDARLAARLTGFKIDIRSETQAREMGLFERMGLQYGDTLSETYEEEAEETESYREYEENYQGDESKQ